MSATSTIASRRLSNFQVVPYVDDLELACDASQRLSIVRWKTTQEQKKAGKTNDRPTLAIAIPAISLNVEPASLKVAMQDAFEDLQDAAIKSWIVDQIKLNSAVNFLSLIVPEELGTDQGIAKFATSQTGNRLSGERIKTWFDAQLSDALTVELLQRKPDMAEDECNKAVEQYRTMISALASPRSNMKPDIAKALQKAISLAGDGSMKNVLHGKLEIFANPPSTETLLAML